MMLLDKKKASYKLTLSENPKVMLQILYLDSRTFPCGNFIFG
jgi:hypothetical protein